MKKILKRIGIIFGVLIGIIIAFSLVLAVFHRINLRIEQERLQPPGHMVDVNGEMMHVYIAGDNDEAPLIVFLTGHGTFAPVYNFKPLYSLLTDNHRIAVIEPFGYGYSDISSASRDIDTVPFLISPHSMSGVLALRWAQVYPDEVAGIFAIDVGLPDMYINGLSQVSFLTLSILTLPESTFLPQSNTSNTDS